MPATLTIHAKEESTYIITVSFTDEDDAAAIPNTIVWTLSNTAGTIVNALQNVAVAVPAAEIEIVLSGNDLQLLAGEVNQGIRVFTVEAVYDSVLKANLPLKGSVRFVVDGLLIVT